MDLLIKFAILFRNHNNKIRVLHLAGVFRAKSESDTKLVWLPFVMETVPLVREILDLDSFLGPQLQGCLA